ncbi:MerR family transcriptional regulator [Deinococcus cellulosilyticus]|uniref:MerR family transcriptional regulator n=1 Tax=Deinococcus cellulosilyticus (strain DSM 18568 / NBRC 106333 / KACC 11606 / 5516J-15) TaxID=1223518 RepID=A0A511N6H0_DEIC1|nr:MerR family transcriptional regulator [Deinococcus cellulosilyticus]GEM48058.1 MerR family transcriptional regulator [Deinococcus cellulosilyticus NBRC 106333 = KACC 11606]
MESQLQQSEELLYSIGELSKLAGLPIKTLRFYADEGLLPPAHIADSRYRYFNADSLPRLQLIRTLREADFSLQSIRELLEQQTDFQALVQLQLQTVQVQMQALVRQQAVLQAALKQHTTVHEFAELMQQARLSHQERENLLSRHLKSTFGGLGVDPEWWPEFWATAGAELPAEATPAQLSAWLELTRLVQDPTFQRAIRAQVEPFWQHAVNSDSVQTHTFEMGIIFDQAVDAAEKGVAPESSEGQSLIAAFSRPCAEALNQSYTPQFLRWWHNHLQTTAHPSVARYWELVALMHGQPVPQIQSGLEWVLAGLETAMKNPDLL